MTTSIPVTVVDALGRTAKLGLPLTIAPAAGLTLEQDWQNRVTAPGVVWFHDFRSQAEVDNFRWTGGYKSGNDPLAKGSGATNLHRLTTDGITGACLEIVRPAGSNDPSHWWRPFSPLKAGGNGKATDDPGAGITPLAWAPTDGSGTTSNWGKGVYGPAAGNDGTEFWMQMRAKIDPQRAQGINIQIDAGKLIYLTLCSVSNAQQELVTTSFEGSAGVDNFAIYCHTNNYAFLPGMPTKWQWPLGQWATIMYHVKPGSGNTCLVEVWAAKPGEKSYTLIYSNASVPMNFDSPHGFQAMICSIYQNGENMTQFYHRFCQIIFSKQPIACPQV